MRTPSILALTCGISLPACALYFEQDPDPGDGPPALECEPRSANAGIPGYPFDFAYYTRVVWPLTQRGCASSGGCHDGQDGFSRGFEVWPEDGDPCSPIRSFNALYDHSDFNRWPEDSLVLRALDGGSLAHPVQPGRGSDEYGTLSYFIESAWFEYVGDDSQRIYFDLDVFQSEIQPMLDDASCASIGCHDVSTSVTAFGLHSWPAWNSDEMYINFENVTRHAELTVRPDETSLFAQATNWHGGSGVADSAALLAWITDAFDKFGVAGD